MEHAVAAGGAPDGVSGGHGAAPGIEPGSRGERRSPKRSLPAGLTGSHPRRQVGRGERLTVAHNCAKPLARQDKGSRSTARPARWSRRESNPRPEKIPRRDTTSVAPLQPTSRWYETGDAPAGTPSYLAGRLEGAARSASRAMSTPLRGLTTWGCWRPTPPSGSRCSRSLVFQLADAALARGSHTTLPPSVESISTPMGANSTNYDLDAPVAGEGFEPTASGL